MLHPWWTDFLQQVVLLVLQVLLASGLVWLHKLVPIVLKWLRQHLTDKERAFLDKVAKEAYWFAETTYGNAGGPEKLTQALNYASAVANKHGLEVTSAEFRAVIEQAVWHAKAEQSAGQVVPKPQL